MLARSVGDWTPENDDLLISTIKCTACGKTWVDREDFDGLPEEERPSKRTAEGGIVCSNCGTFAVWEWGVTKVGQRQG